MELEDIKKLAIMARIDMSEREMAEMANDFDSILAYVDQIKEISASSVNSDTSSQDPKEKPFLFNIMREDVATNKSGEYTEKILEEMND